MKKTKLHVPVILPLTDFIKGLKETRRSFIEDIVRHYINMNSSRVTFGFALSDRHFTCNVNYSLELLGEAPVVCCLSLMTWNCKLGRQGSDFKYI